MRDLDMEKTGRGPFRMNMPVGISSYKDIVDKDYAYVDKTLAIRDILDRKPGVLLFTRPRRFGKTLLLSTLKTFFEEERDRNGRKIDNTRYFRDRKISCAGERYMAHCGAYPVISVSLKDARGDSFELAFGAIRNALVRELRRHAYLLSSASIFENDKKKYRSLWEGSADISDYADGLRFLSDLLHIYSGKKTVILVDEYDVPLQEAYANGYYDKMSAFIRTFLSVALKDSDSLEFAIMAGCLETGRASILAGLDDLSVFSVLDCGFGEYFGFLEEEVRELLDRAGIPDRLDEVRSRYDGYVFGETKVYNPWSINRYLEAHLADKNAAARNYWSDTSSNDVVQEFIARSDRQARDMLETLLQGGTVDIPVREDMVYADIYSRPENLWNTLYFTGYLTKVSEQTDPDTGARCVRLKIPNKEVDEIYRTTVSTWFEDAVRNNADRDRLLAALRDKEDHVVENILNDLLIRSISYHDSKESFYHGFLSGVLSGYDSYAVKSNRESGDGRPDIMLIPQLPLKDPLIVLEIKALDAIDGSKMEDGVKAALEQIGKKRYTSGIDGIRSAGVVAYGICFSGKNCMVRLYKDKK